ncbi:MAG: VUT family protein, partial [Saprospiraceae bacterium]
SQFIDSYVVLIIAFYVGAQWPLAQVIAIGTVNYFYKVTLAILLLPAIYIMHYVIEKYLGKDLAEKMRTDAMEN